MQSTESVIVLDENTNMVISKVFVCAVRYYYDTEDGLTKKHIKFADGKEFTENYEKTENDSQVVEFTAGGKTVASHSKTDSFGRKVFDELQLSTGFISRQFHYHAGLATQEHVDNNMLKSSPTTQLVSQIVLSGGRTISYEYDKEERITKVDDSVDGITEYTYDALGQLVSEVKDNQTVVNTMTYDNYGNILTKNGVVYDYDTVWKDKLIKVGDKTITYDEQGNPTQYLGHNLTWEKGRQLKSFEKVENGSTKKVINYTYNANGIRISKTVDNIRHDFVLDGAKILRETWEVDDVVNSIVPLYDNEDSVCGIEYNDTAYYFLKNLQGDIIAITDSSGEEVARYSYDAWGVCTVTKDISDCNIANINPFRYRGYFYDLEIGLYYLQSRYYNPTVGRFINSDDATVLEIEKSILNHNLCTYCKNEPINNFDPYGYWVLTIGVSWGIAAILGVNFFLTLLIDSTCDYGLFLGATLLYGVVKKGLSGSPGIYWGFKKIKDYLNSVTVGFAAGYVVGGALVYNYYKYPSSKKKLVGLQISYGTIGLYRETAPFNGGLYIPLKSKLKKFFASCGNNFWKLKSRIKKLKIKVYR